MRERGFTVLELSVAATLLVVMLASATVALTIDSRAAQVITAQVSPEIAARTALERITTELRMAGVRGEDRNGDGQMDPSEDLNGNGELDSDWNLDDGAKKGDITFNRRVELRYSKEDLVAQSEYSRAVTYRLEGDKLLRITRETLPDGNVRERSTVLARRIAGMRFARTKSVIRVEIDVKLPKGAYKRATRTLAMSVRLRN